MFSFDKVGGLFVTTKISISKNMSLFNKVIPEKWRTKVTGLFVKHARNFNKKGHVLGL